MAKSTKQKALDQYEGLIKRGTALANNAESYRQQLSAINNQLAEVEGALKALEELYSFDRQVVAKNMQEKQKKEEA